MKKKIKYASISKDALNHVIGEYYGLGDYTLKDELNKYGEDILVARYHLKKDRHGKYFEYFHAWTKTYALILIDGLSNEKYILGLERHPPAEIKYGK